MLKAYGQNSPADHNTMKIIYTTLRDVTSVVAAVTLTVAIRDTPCGLP